MKIGVVIDNLPYQDGKRSIYHQLILQSIELNPKCINMIVKNNWLGRDEFIELSMDTYQTRFNVTMEHLICGGAS